MSGGPSGDDEESRRRCRGGVQEGCRDDGNQSKESEEKRERGEKTKEKMESSHCATQRRRLASDPCVGTLPQVESGTYSRDTVGAVEGEEGVGEEGSIEALILNRDQDESVIRSHDKETRQHSLAHSVPRST